MKTITIDITNCLYYGLPPLIMFIICMWYLIKHEYDNDVHEDIYDYITYISLYTLLSLTVTTLFSLIYFGIFHLILDYHYIFRL